jgi:dTDP-4-amino-4,6-dideoxygalactose transaminase
MPNVNAALLLAQLEKLEDFRASKSLVYNKYQSFFGTNIKAVELVPIPETTSQWNYWLMSVQLENREARDEFLDKTNSQGVMTRPIWQLMYKLPMYSDCQRDDQVNAEFLEDTIVNIPSSAINEKI